MKRNHSKSGGPQGLLARRLPRQGRAGFLLWQGGLLLAACAVLTLCCLWLSCADYGSAVFWGFFEAPLIPAVNLLVCLALCLVLFALTGRLWLGYGLTALVCLGVAIGNYYLILIRTDPLQFQDLLCLREALNITQTQHYELQLSAPVLGGPAAALVCTVLLGLLSRWRPALGMPRLTALLAALGAALGLGLWVQSPALFQATKHYDHIDTWSSTQIYVSRGVLYSFTRSALVGTAAKPRDYSAKEAEADLAQFAQADIPQDRKVDVIVIMRESYNDLSRLSSTPGAVDWSCYDPYHALAAESLTGELVTNGFGGNTKNAERCFLTGDYALQEWRKPTNSYLWYLKGQGYRLEGAHPFNGWFYNRKNVNRYLGFDDYLFREEYFDDLVGPDTVAEDEVLYDKLLQMYEAHEDGPYFQFSVTYQGHGPYSYRRNNYPWRFVLQDADTADGYALNNYLGCVYARDLALTGLVDRLRQSPRPVVLLTFGDHNPTLGADINNYTTAAYTHYGINMDLSTQEGFLDYYATEYLIWANDAARQTLGLDLAGQTGPTISPCFLMNVLFDTLGWGEGPAYLQAMDQIRQELPVVSTNGRVMAKGQLVTSVSGPAQSAYHRLQQLNYYWQTRFLYGELVQEETN